MFIYPRFPACIVNERKRIEPKLKEIKWKIYIPKSFYPLIYTIFIYFFLIFKRSMLDETKFSKCLNKKITFYCLLKCVCVCVLYLKITETEVVFLEKCKIRKFEEKRNESKWKSKSWAWNVVRCVNSGELYFMNTCMLNCVYVWCLVCVLEKLKINWQRESWNNNCKYI